MTKRTDSYKKSFLSSPEIFDVLDISTVHIEGDDADLLEGMQSVAGRKLAVDKGYNGYWVCVALDDDPRELQNDLATEGFSAPFIQIVLLAHARGYSWVKFDSDGAVYDDLIQHAW